MKRLTKVTTIFDRGLDLATLLAAVLLIFTLLLVSAGVVMRYFLRTPIPWVVEISEYNMLYITFLVVAWVLKKEGHVKIDILLSRLKPRARAILNIITSVCCAAMCLPLVWYGGRLAWEYILAGRYETTTLELHIGYVMAIIPVGCSLLFIQFLRRIHGYLASWRAPSNKQ